MSSPKKSHSEHILDFEKWPRLKTSLTFKKPANLERVAV
jgi:hypothetical protein